MKQGAAYLGANLLAQASALVRYVVMARLLGAEELGLAAMLILTAQFFESISDSGADRLLVQDRDGDSPRLQGFAQLMLVGRGLMIAGALVFFAPPLAVFYKAPTLAISLIHFAVVPLIGGFIHLDMRRLQRGGDFRPESLGMAASELASLATIAVAAYLTRDHTAAIWGLAARSMTLVLVSHITSKRPYRWAFGRQEARKFSLFAAPLFANGLLLFVGSQGDRMLIGGTLGPAALGHYSAILLLIYYPCSAIAHFFSGLHLPAVARARDDPAQFEFERNRLGGRTTLLALAMAAGFAVVGPLATPVFYGSKFIQPAPIFAMLAMMQTGRLLRLWPTTLAIATGRSTIVMFNNMARMVAVPTALAANWLAPSLESIVAGFVVGEVVALVGALALLARAGVVDIKSELARVGEFIVGSCLIVAWAWSVHEHDAIVMPFLIVATVLGLAVLVRRERRVVRDDSRRLIEILRRRLGGPSRPIG